MDGQPDQFASRSDLVQHSTTHDSFCDSSTTVFWLMLTTSSRLSPPVPLMMHLEVSLSVCLEVFLLMFLSMTLEVTLSLPVYLEISPIVPLTVCLVVWLMVPLEILLHTLTRVLPASSVAESAQQTGWTRLQQLILTMMRVFISLADRCLLLLFSLSSWSRSSFIQSSHVQLSRSENNFSFLSSKAKGKGITLI